MAQLALPPDVAHRNESLRRAYALGQTINANFDQVQSMGDAVIFEFGASRAANLTLRNHFRKLQSRLRAMFLLRGAALRYCLEMPGFELPPQLETAQKEVDKQMSAAFDGMADHMEGVANPKTNDLAAAFEQLEEAAKACDASASINLSDFMALSRRSEEIVLSVAQDVQQEIAAL